MMSDGPKDNSLVIAVALQSRRRIWHVPASLNETRCGISILRPVKIEMKRRCDRKMCQNCMK